MKTLGIQFRGRALGCLAYMRGLWVRSPALEGKKAMGKLV
jgi:hypothetical protein